MPLLERERGKKEVLVIFIMLSLAFVIPLEEDRAWKKPNPPCCQRDLSTDFIFSIKRHLTRL